MSGDSESLRKVFESTCISSPTKQPSTSASNLEQEDPTDPMAVLTTVQRKHVEFLKRRFNIAEEDAYNQAVALVPRKRKPRSAKAKAAKRAKTQAAVEEGAVGNGTESVPMPAARPNPSNAEKRGKGAVSASMPSAPANIANAPAKRARLLEEGGGQYLFMHPAPGQTLTSPL